ncbi:ammonia-dependent NAD(+) synthetase [Facklamia miroungae]|uniref:NH(3)-dependent NAD(+) synthetase n=1 Tax=Facklamia miroungae TaxID=120956 RepID=A0A1G7SHK0_9LACT|nr:ammonia-dependent NAD(+) synthetase [Facklamia miroungae]NKZ29651.1 ammonia-dependent NAD(+) synthetase [Facklamia miroungae]SDG22421.1 NAD+ synthase [Facklamia miroungae]
MRPLQKEIIENLKVLPHIDPHREIRRSIDFLKDYLQRYPGLKALVLGISGGQDSTLAGKLSQMAITEMREETGDQAYQFIAVRLPFAKQNDEADALKAISYIQPDRVLHLNIEEATEGIVSSLKKESITINDFNKGNIKARQRMIMQYAVASHFSGVVIGTDHAAESVTGFFTKFGDGSADLMPLWRLTKGQGKELLKLLDCPPELYQKVPTADLEEDRPMMPDEQALGVTYQAIDRYLTGESIVDKDAEIIEKWYLASQHKRHLPITIFDHFWR